MFTTNRTMNYRLLTFLYITNLRTAVHYANYVLGTLFSHLHQTVWKLQLLVLLTELIGIIGVRYVHVKNPLYSVLIVKSKTLLILPREDRGQEHELCRIFFIYYIED